MAEPSDTPAVPSELSAKILSFPETHMGVQTVALVLRDGRFIEDIEIAWGREVIRVGGQDEPNVPWHDVVDVLDRS